jgi:sugar phosphate isomerase/epimerase
VTRREILTATASATLLSALSPSADAQAVANPKGNLGMGGAPTAFVGRRGGAGPARGAARGSYEPPPFSDEFLDYCHSIGLGGAEMGLPPSSSDAIHKFRDKVQTYDMHVIFNVPLPRSEDDVTRFDGMVKTASEAGAFGLHAAMTGRRYEDFKTLEAYQKSFAENQKTVALAEPVLRKHKVRLAVENHKGWRAVEQAAWMKRLSSEYVGVHLDFGNNVAFCEDPMFTLETLKPWVISGHIKDMAVQPYGEGFLLSEVPFGEGFLDLKKMVDILREKDSKMPLDLEMITRDPLKVPIFTDQYWVTFEEVPGRQVAHLMEIIQKNPLKKPLPTIAGLDGPARKQLEENYNLSCIKYARQNLGL